MTKPSRWKITIAAEVITDRPILDQETLLSIGERIKAAGALHPPGLASHVIVLLGDVRVHAAVCSGCNRTVGIDEICPRCLADEWIAGVRVQGEPVCTACCPGHDI